MRKKRAIKSGDLPAEARLLYDKQGAAEQLSMGVRTLEYYISAGDIRTLRVGTRIRIHRSQLVTFAKANHPFPVRQGHGYQRAHFSEKGNTHQS
jgi:excisionase family DNA binding protein